MIILLEDRELVAAGIIASLRAIGMAVDPMSREDFEGWLLATEPGERRLVEGFLIGCAVPPITLMGAMRKLCGAPIVGLVEPPALETTLALFAAGADDVARKPVHPRELLARLNAVRRRGPPLDEDDGPVDIRVYFDGRDAEVCGEPFPLPRRERRILEFLAFNRPAWVTRARVHSAVFGTYDDRDIPDIVVQSHISKLRTKLRSRLTYEAIETKRFLGYRIATKSVSAPSTFARST